MLLKAGHPLFTRAHLYQKGREIKYVAEANIPEQPPDTPWFLYHPRGPRYVAGTLTHSRVETPFTVLVEDGGGLEVLWSSESGDAIGDALEAADGG